MRRREVIAGLMLSLLASGVRAQSGRANPARIGLLNWGTASPGVLARLDSFSDELKSLGYSEGRDLIIDKHFAEGSAARANAIIAGFIQQQVDLIVAAATPSVHAAKAATKDIPIVMFNVADPLATGIVESLSYPGGNITGVTFFGPETASKRVELLREVTPGLTVIGFLGSKLDPNTASFVRQIETAAGQIGASLQPVLVDGQPEEFERAFAQFRERVQAVMVQPLFIIDRAREIAALALLNKLPTISDDAPFARSGGLLSYGAEWSKLSRRAAHFVDRILKGARPGDLPVELPTEFELVINMKTARALGLTIPVTLLARADEVIE